MGILDVLFPKQTTPAPTIVLVDHLKTPLPDDLKHVARALEYQANHHFGDPRPGGWGLRCKVRVATKRKPAKRGEIQLGLFEDPDMADALGYHDLDEFGVPTMKVFPRLDAGPDFAWTVTASHEVLETMVDADLVWCAQAPDGRIWAAEVCDAVQSDTYEIGGVQVSNFVLPSYFAPPKNRTGCCFDHMKLIKEPYEIRPGGYGQYLTRTGWVSISKPPERGKAARRPRGRRAKVRNDKYPQFEGVPS
jgi:hypothetical protein